MKKHFLYLMAAAAAMTACSTNDVVGDAGNGAGIVSAEEQQVIGIGAAINAQPVKTTRATVGGVGSDDETHSWHGESLYLFMTKKSTIDPATEGNETGAIFWNTKAIAPSPTTGESTIYAPSGLLTRYDSQVKYYPLADYNEATQKYGFDFYGYYDGKADDTRTDAKYYTVTDGQVGEGSETYSTAATFVGVPFEIDGSNDLLAGKAKLSTDDESKLKDGQSEANQQAAVERAYSAWAARRGVQPSIDFNHLLTRLQFNVIAGNAITAGKNDAGNDDNYHEAMKVTGIKVTGLPKSGHIIVASVDEVNYPHSSLIWSAEDASGNVFALKDDAGKEISAENAIGLTGEFEDGKFTGTKVTIGDALMVKAGETKYQIEVTLQQKVRVKEKDDELNTDTDANWEVKTQTLTGTIDLSKAITGEESDKTFQAGTSYTVNITVYGYEKIDVTGNIVKWATLDKAINVDIDDIDNEWGIK